MQNNFLQQQLLAKQVEIEAWLREQWRVTPPPFYASVDLRNAGFKIAPVDTNLFPAGFNNLNQNFIPLAIQAAQAALEQICPEATRVLLIPESHTRNLFYLENVVALQEILIKAGFETRIGSLLPDLNKGKEITLPSGKKLFLEPLLRQDNTVGVKKFFPSVVLLNNDFSSGIPEILKNIQQKILPPFSLGWATRLKSIHFKHYKVIVDTLSSQLKLDPWLMQALFAQCGKVNFMEGDGIECLVENISKMLKNIAEKYQQYRIDKKPFVMVKADAGTYGMAVMSLHDPEQIIHLNRKQRSHMSAIKGGKPVTQVMIQEGIYTSETKNAASAEPVVYMIGKHVVGGFYRVHANRGEDENLNSPGMRFEPLPFSTVCNNPELQKSCEAECNQFYVYGIVARLALLAAARELAAIPSP